MAPILGSRSFINSAEMGLPCAQLALDTGDTEMWSQLLWRVQSDLGDVTLQSK